MQPFQAEPGPVLQGTLPAGAHPKALPLAWLQGSIPAASFQAGYMGIS